MSLINQMLQDLEKRQTSHDASSESQTAQYAQFGTPAPEKKNSFAMWILIGILIASGLWLFARNLKKSATIPPQVIPELSDTKAQSASQAVPSIASLPLLLKMSTDISASPTNDEAPQTTKEPATVGDQASLRTTDVQASVAANPRIVSQEKNASEASGKFSSTPIAKPDVKGADSVALERQEPRNQKDGSAGLDTPKRSDTRQPESRASANVEKLSEKLSEKAAPASIPLIVKEVSPQQRAEGEYKQATVYQQQGRNAEAIQSLQQTLALDQNHAPARQLLVSLLLDAKRYEDAIRELRLGLALDSHQVNLAMVLARLLVERAKVVEAVEVLQKSVAYAQERADYLAFLAALQQKLNHHKEAIGYYRMALARHTQNGVWWMGLGISLQAEGNQQDALEAFRQAKTQPGLGADLIAFVDQRIAQLQK